MFDYNSVASIEAVFSAENVVLMVIISIINVLFMGYLARKFMQIIQQSGYSFGDYIKWVHRRDNVYVTRVDMIAMLSGLAYLIYSIALSFADINWVAPSAFVFYLFFMIRYIRSDFKRKSKCPLVLTSRMIRLYLTYSLIYFVFSMAVLIGANLLGYLFRENEILLRVRYVLICLSPLIVQVFVPFANALNRPWENAKNRKYIEKCKQKLEAYPDLIKIGITGSYGKTSVKEILKTVLSEKYNVLYTPKSYNTPLGICKTVKKLDDTYDVFIAEMGARHEGDIKELCDIVKPEYGIINGIIEHHLDTFTSLNQIKKTKFELVGGMNGGAVVLTADNEHTLSMADKCGRVKVVTAGVDTSKNPDVYATDVTVDGSGSRFTIHIGDNSTECSTVLLGTHNVSNILLAAALAYELGLSVSEIAAGIAHVSPIRHRMEILKNDNGVTVIDDSYNSNVSGTKAAVEVFSHFNGRKIIITPGMVELGRIEDHENVEFGKRLAGAVDIAILVGLYGGYRIRDGLLSKDFPLENVYLVKDLDNAMAEYKKMSRPGDVVLFENDLPDKFS